MQDIYNLDINVVNQLAGIDPVLNPDWQEILDGIIPQLDEESQTVVASTVLAPKGIIYSKTTGKYFAKKPATLAQTLQSLPLQNKQLIKAAQILQDVYQTAPPLITKLNPMMCTYLSTN
ncbi:MULTISPECIES: hypothetical protein [Moraxella]|uniref:hypothetical protein n=2 Tax=Moraxellaceae TaxID=468 RepID=UPI00187EC016|nr:MULTISPECIES: hypothetical protein [Moraxella]MBE9588208.1 hypothetical protein [Moraxella sp. K1630]MDH9218399.1 hypothetical protein [Moraxella lacunata]MDI4507038.1 hypothetical protein [Moraxella lacunata]